MMRWLSGVVLCRRSRRKNVFNQSNPNVLYIWILKIMSNEIAVSNEIELQAFAFRKLVAHLRLNSESVQNIDIMNLAGFCRNCLV